MNKKHTCS